MQRRYLIAVALVLATLVAYEPLRVNDFVRLDDPAYITANPHVQAGLSRAGLDWAFNVGATGNWHPLTWLAHMLDVSLWGLDPRGHHLTSLALHAASVVLLFLLLRRMTGAEGKSAFVAAVFALHPLHVESVAWAAERKDVLSTLLGFLSLWFWVEWTRKGGKGLYLASLALFGSSLMAKPMLVTLPFLLLLLDHWPLARFAAAGTKPVDARRAGTPGTPAGGTLRARLREKLPFFALALVSCAITVVAQTEGKAVADVDALPLSYRLGNAASAFASYLGKVIWPTDLAVFYPHPLSGLPEVEVLVGSLILVAATAVALHYGRRLPWLAVGWLWWVGMLFPVIGIVQVGKQSMADRYTYVPLIGLAIVVAWGTEHFTSRWKPGRVAATALGIALACAWVALTRGQVKIWKDDFTLFAHAARVTQGNYLAHFRVGFALLEQHRFDEAIAQYELAVRYDPNVADAHNDYGVALFNSGRYDEAIPRFSEAIRLRPGVAETYFNLASAQTSKGLEGEALKSIRAGLRLLPDSPRGQSMLENALRRQKR